jgi:hypothetical protein
MLCGLCLRLCADCACVLCGRFGALCAMLFKEADAYAQVFGSDAAPLSPPWISDPAAHVERVGEAKGCPVGRVVAQQDKTPASNVTAGMELVVDNNDCPHDSERGPAVEQERVEAEKEKVAGIGSDDRSKKRKRHVRVYMNRNARAHAQTHTHTCMPTK